MEIFYGLLLLLTLTCSSLGQRRADIIERSQSLDENVSVSWTVDFPIESVVFTVTAKTLGSINFGLSHDKGHRNRTDVIIGGIRDGLPYFTDRFTNGTEESMIDDHQDWFLLEASETLTETVLRFHRKFDTCDSQDLVINGDTIRFLWSLGESDDDLGTEWKMTPVNLLDPDSSSADTSMYDIWEFSRTTDLEGGVDTTEWCTIHKTPKESSKRHIVGYKMMMDTPEARKHIHHVNINRCITKSGSPAREQLEKFVGHHGGTCFLRTSDPDLIQSTFIYCPETVYFWGKGGEALFLPEDVGRSLNEDGDEEYFIFQVHYDNPEKENNVTVDTRFQFFTTPILRRYEPALLFTGDSTDISVVVPPATSEYVIAGHCSGNCTGSYFPEGGIHVFNVMMHTHNAGVQMRVRHFRPGSDGKFKELPWILNDNNYDNNWQQTRGLKETVNILPGDHITVECTYDNTWRSPPEVTLGGGSANSEMCRAYLMYYPKMEKLGACVSQYPLDKLLTRFGIQELDLTNYEDPTVLRPPEMANKSYSTVLNTMIDWTEEFRAELQQATRFDDDHFDYCLELPIWDTKNPRSTEFLLEDPPMTNYPEDFELYEPPNQCTRKQ